MALAGLIPGHPETLAKGTKTRFNPRIEMLPIGGDIKKTITFGDFADDPVADSAIEFMSRKRDRPFLLGVSLHNPHDICHQVMGKLIPDHPSYRTEEPDRYDSYPSLPPNFKRDPKEPEFISICRRREKYGPENTYTTEWDETRWRIYLYEYFRMTERVDRTIGRLLHTLRENGLEDDTLIVFTSDHGEGMAAHEWVVKLMLYEEPILVPFAIQWKGTIPEGAINRKHFISGMDILPTICEYANVPLPKPVTGTSLRPMIESPESPGRDSIVVELGSDKYNHSMLGRMIRTDRYKYIVFSEGKNPEMFFDHQTDPWEKQNRIAEPSLQNTIAQHRAQLKQWIEETGDHFVFPPNIG